MGQGFLPQIDHKHPHQERSNHVDRQHAQREAGASKAKAGNAHAIARSRSDRAGPVSALVTANVYDSPTGRYVLIPQGARLIGVYDTDIRAGDQRVQVAWTRIIFQDGRSIILERLPASDPAGFAGLQDKVNRHWGRLFLAAGLTTLLGVAGEFGADGEDEIADTFRNSLSREADRTATRLIDRELDIPPTLTIRPGFPVRAIVQRDLVLEPQ